jgi:hypothetical protein
MLRLHITQFYRIHHLGTSLGAFGPRALLGNLFEHAADVAGGHILAVIRSF